MKRFKDIKSFFKTEPSINKQPRQANDPNVVETFESVRKTASCSQTSISAYSCNNSLIPANKFSDDLGSLDSGPCQPKLGQYPKTQVKDRLRAFSSKYFELYKWLEYSISSDRVYCFVCRHFSSPIVRRQNEAFLSGFNKWRKLGEALLNHEACKIHAQCVQGHITYNASKSAGKSVCNMVHEQSRNTIKMHREYLEKVIDLTMCLSRQGLAFRGHDESGASDNRGNFLEFCELFARHDPTFEKHFKNKVANYCSGKSQNEIIETIAEIVREDITAEIKDCGLLAIMADEARVHKQEQLSVVVRFAKELIVEERFLGFVDCSGARDASSLANIILSLLDSYGLGESPIIGQSYDGASVMSGQKGGVQTKIKLKHPAATFVHCLAHRVNLVVMDTCSTIETCTSFFNAIESLYIHFSKPSHHQLLKQLQEALGLNTRRELGSLSSTRWSMRFHNCECVIHSYGAIKEALEKEMNEGKDKDSVYALGIFQSISNPKFVVNLFIFHYVLSITNMLSKFFQTKNATLWDGMELVNGTVKTLLNERKNFSVVWEKINSFAEKHCLDLTFPRGSRKRKAAESTSFKGFAVSSNLGPVDSATETHMSDYEQWQAQVYYRVIDNVVSHLQDRFQSADIVMGIKAFFELNFNESKPFTSLYCGTLQIDSRVLEAEMLVTKNMMKFGESLLTVVKKEIQPNIFKLLQIALILPVTSASCERSFSTMRRIKNWLRSTSTQERFSNLSIMNIESNLLKSISKEKVLNRFCTKDRRLRLE